MSSTDTSTSSQADASISNQAEQTPGMLACCTYLVFCKCWAAIAIVDAEPKGGLVCAAGCVQLSE